MTKSIIITGTGCGIGAATTKAFLEAGYKVGLVGRNADTLAATVDVHPDALVLASDVGDPDAVERIFATAMEAWGRIDVLFNNAGRGSPPRTPDETSIEDWMDIMRINLTGSFLRAHRLCRHALAIAAGRADHQQRIGFSACAAPRISALYRHQTCDHRPPPQPVA